VVPHQRGCEDLVRERAAEITPKPLRDVVRAAIGLGRRAGYARARWPRPLGTRPRHYLAVCAIFRNEARYLAEWVTFHRLQGVERFWLYDNRSTDNWQAALEPELAKGIVEVTSWPTEPGQLTAYADCLRVHPRDARWLAFIDLDEFLFSPTGRTLPEVLRSFEFHPAVAVNWRTYGPNGHVDTPDGLIVENYLQRVRDDLPVNEHVKSIVYPRKTSQRVENPHMFRLHGQAVGEDGRPVSTAFRRQSTVELLRINHYWARSLNDLRHRYGRPDPGTGGPRARGLHFFADALEEVDGLQVPRDEVHDDLILQYVPPLRRALDER
jgi:Glycosyltransferase family 92